MLSQTKITEMCPVCLYGARSRWSVQHLACKSFQTGAGCANKSSMHLNLRTEKVCSHSICMFGA
jgi:hypothetical protein